MGVKSKLSMVFFLLLSNNAYSALVDSTCSEELGTCYVGVKFDTLQTWNFTESYGQDNFGYDLAAIHSQEEMNFVDSWLRDSLLTSIDSYSIGGKFLDSFCGDLVWVSGVAFTGYTNWSSGEPNLCSMQKSIAVDETGQWFNTEQSTPILSGAVYSYSYTSAVVPIPAAAWLFGTGLLGLIGISRRKKA